MTVRLRAHHLLCMLTYVGRGYTPDFTAGYDAVVKRLGRGEEILLVAGPDDICATLLSGDDPHCLKPGVTERDTRAAAAVAALMSRPLGPADRVTVDSALLARMRGAFAEGRTRAACGGCEWESLCTSIAADDFREARLAPKP